MSERTDNSGQLQGSDHYAEREGARQQYPVCLSVDGRRCVVLGGGLVAERKVLGLLAAGARVVVISPSLTPRLTELFGEGRVEYVARSYQDGDLANAYLAIFATDNPVANRNGLAEARQRNVLVNVVDEPAISDFTLPAVLRRGDLVVAVSTNGRSPVAARFIRDQLSALITAEHLKLVQIMAEARADLVSRGLRVSGEVWRSAIDGQLLDLIARGRWAEARERLMERLVDAGGV